MSSNSIAKTLTFSTNCLKQQVKRSFILHRDLKSCLSFQQLQTMIRARKEQVQNYGRTAFLQTLNNFSFNHAQKSLKGSLKVFLYANQFTNLTRYQQMLKYTIFLKLTQQLVRTQEKAEIYKIVNQQELFFINSIKNDPFDTVDAMLFMIYQKQTSNDQLFYHSLNVLKNSKYEQIQGVLVKMMPTLLKRLTINEWNILRKFNYLIELIAYSYAPAFVGKATYIFILNQISRLQLHIVGYTKIPPAIDIIYSIFINQNNKLKSINFMQLTSLFQAFNYLPLNYNETAFIAIYKEILSRSQNENLHFNNLPYRRMSQKQIQNLYESYLKSHTIFKSLLFSGNFLQFRKYLYQSQAIQIFISEYFKIDKIDSQKNLISFITASHILLEKFKTNKQKKQVLMSKYFEIIKKFNDKKNIIQYYKAFFSMGSILNFFHLALQSQNSDLYHMSKFLNKQYIIQLSSANNEMYHVSMLIEAVKLHMDSDQPQMRLLLIKLHQIVIQNINKFHFCHFSYIIFQLMKSNYVTQYQPIINMIMNSIKNQQLQYFVQLFNGYPNKTFKLKIKLIDTVWEKDKSFKNIGKFMVSSTFKYFTSNRGELTLDMRNKLQALQPTINFEDLSEFLLNQLTYILRFCSHFFYYISNFTKKLQLILLKNINLQKYKKQGLGVYIIFIQESINLSITSQTLNRYQNLIIMMIQQAKELFQINTYFKAKQIQWRSILKKIDNDQKQIMLDQIISDLSNDNYSLKSYNTFVLLIKINLVGIIQLNEPLKQKLEYLINTTVSQNSPKAYELIRLLSIKYYKLGGLTAVQQNNMQLQAIMLKALQYSSKQGSQYYLQYVDFAHQFTFKNLFKIALQKLSKLQLTPAQIKNIMKYLKEYRGMNLDEIYSSILTSGHNHLQSISLAVPDLLFDFFLAKININHDQLVLSQSIIKKNDKQIIKLLQINKTKNKHNKSLDDVSYNRIIKHLYVCIQSDMLQVVSKPILSKFITGFQNFRDITHLFKYEFSQQEIKILYLAILKHLQTNQPQLLDEICKGNKKAQQQTQKSFLKKKSSVSKYSTGQFIKYMRNKVSKGIFQMHESVVPSKLQQLELILRQKGFQKRNDQKIINEKMYNLNKIIHNIVLDIYVKTELNRQYGILYLDKKYLTQDKQIDGRVRFIVKSYQIITGFKIIAYNQGQQLILE